MLLVELSIRRYYFVAEHISGICRIFFERLCHKNDSIFYCWQAFIAWHTIMTHYNKIFTKNLIQLTNKECSASHEGPELNLSSVQTTFIFHRSHRGICSGHILIPKTVVLWSHLEQICWSNYNALICIGISLFRGLVINDMPLHFQ